MKKSELIKIIKEEIGKVLKEEDLDNYPAKLAARENALKKLKTKLDKDKAKSLTAAVGPVQRALDLIVKASENKTFRYTEEQMFQLLANMYNARGPAGAEAFENELQSRFDKHVADELKKQKEKEKKNPKKLDNIDLVRRNLRKKNVATTP